jgi:nucleoside-diphosphate-sugar epimerase
VTSLPPLCLTGASGFIGRRVLARLAALGATNVTLLLRDSSRAPLEMLPAWRSANVDLSGASIPQHAIPVGAVVLHLAATTGAADARRMQRVNVNGTARLLDAAAAAGARRFVFVSSVAAGYADQRWAPYAASKMAAEDLVSAARIPHTIVRPTMVFGRGSPNQRALARLATLPVPMLPGQGNVRVQPIHVDDLANALLYIASASTVSGDVVTVGGPSVVTIRELYAAMRRAERLTPRKPLVLPLELMRRTLALLGGVVGARLPVSAGQFAAFANDAVAGTPPPGVHLPVPQVSLAAMLAQHEAHA